MAAPVWRKSSRSTEGTTGDCVELADLSGLIGVRDSKAPNTGHLTLTPATFGNLLTHLKQNGSTAPDTR
ncbi:hypothetical protein GCM10023085_09440 [Actinomadura viridis]|uniref:DUF397 domain-containing protein n=1 Tax=Actinomadura viridis TaxID=58110 RepID=A0A931GQP1_9ACTN|nr:DUF397 domain-containing protein [Actinomadura viridis]MBG6091956.1 hypothetical protein [Actinomadura viridis]